MADCWLLVNARLATMAAPAGLGLVERGVVACRDGRIAFAGRAEELPPDLLAGAEEVTDCGGRLVTPGLVDCHTHLVQRGERSAEFERRLGGASYEDLARSGGGILSSVAATRASTEDQLLAGALRRLDALLGEGVTTVEVKSGYGLDLATEARMLRVARRLGRERRVSVAATFLGAHALPAEAARDCDAYVAEVEAMLPVLAAEGLVDAVDAFCESIAFSPGQVSRVFAAAARLGLPVKLHADQLSDLGGPPLAARFGALSADHLEHASEEGVGAMAAAGTVAVLLPGAYYFLREDRRPPVDALRRHDARMAVATDRNPGTSPLASTLAAANMAATLSRLTPSRNAWRASRARRRAPSSCSTRPARSSPTSGATSLWDVERLAELVCRIGPNPLHSRVWRGTHEAAR